MKILQITPTIEVQEVSLDLFADATEVYLDRNNALAMFRGVVDDSKSLFVCNNQPDGKLTDITNEQIKTIRQLLQEHKPKANPYTFTDGACSKSLVLLDMDREVYGALSLLDIMDEPPSILLSMDRILKKAMSPEGTLFSDLIESLSPEDALFLDAIRLHVKAQGDFFYATVSSFYDNHGVCPLWVITGLAYNPAPENFWKLMQSRCNTGAEDEIQKFLDFFHPNAPLVACHALDNPISELLNQTTLPRFIPSLAVHLAVAHFFPGLIDPVRLFGSP